MKCMGVPDDVPISRNLRRKMNINDETGITQMYLLGQFARSDDSEPGTGSRLLNDALDIIHGAYIAVGCRVVRVDCADDLVPYTRATGSHSSTRMRTRTSTDWSRSSTDRVLPIPTRWHPPGINRTSRQCKARPTKLNATER